MSHKVSNRPDPVDLFRSSTSDQQLKPCAAHWCCAATLKLGSRKSGDSGSNESGTGIGGLLGTITRSLSRQGVRPGPKDEKTVSNLGLKNAYGCIMHQFMHEWVCRGVHKRVYVGWYATAGVHCCLHCQHESAPNDS